LSDVIKMVAVSSVTLHDQDLIKYDTASGVTTRFNGPLNTVLTSNNRTLRMLLQLN